MEAAGVVLIDRGNTASAIEAMTPLVDAMRVEGKSVCLSPEGTRAVTPRLAEFKKGAFHLAMQAEVPIVPASPFERTRGHFDFSPTIAGISPGSFEGQVVLRNRHANQSERESTNLRATYTMVRPGIFEVSTPKAK